MSGAKLFKECDTGIDSIIHNNINLTVTIYMENKYFRYYAADPRLCFCLCKTRFSDDTAHFCMQLIHQLYISTTHSGLGNSGAFNFYFCKRMKVLVG